MGQRKSASPGEELKPVTVCSGWILAKETCGVTNLKILFILDSTQPFPMLVGSLECRNQRVANYKEVKNEVLILTRIVGHLQGSLFAA